MIVAVKGDSNPAPATCHLAVLTSCLSPWPRTAVIPNPRVLCGVRDLLFVLELRPPKDSNRATPPHEWSSRGHGFTACGKTTVHCHPEQSGGSAFQKRLFFRRPGLQPLRYSTWPVEAQTQWALAAGSGSASDQGIPAEFVPVPTWSVTALIRHLRKAGEIFEFGVGTD